MELKAIRGATTADNTERSINQSVVELYDDIVRQNALDVKSIVCVIVSTTTDLKAACPATAIRMTYEKGCNPPLFSVTEPEFDNAMTGVIRLLILAYTDKCSHVYKKETEKLIGRNL